MNILITGGNGYIAKSLSNGLWRGMNRYDITSITRKDFNLTDREATSKWFKDKYFDVVIHTAVVGGSRLHDDDADVLYQNLQMFFNLYDNKHCFGKLINFGSGAELGMPNDPYGLSKKSISKFIDAEPFFYNIRIYGVFNENEWDTRFIKSNIKRYINKEHISVYEDKLMDFFYMKDLIELVRHFIYKDNLPKNVDCTYDIDACYLSDIAYIINDLSNYKVEIKVGEGKGKKYIGDWNPININYIGLEQGIKETYKKLSNEEYQFLY